MNQIPFELQSLREGVRYQKWLANTVEPFLGQKILEVGSGIGNLSQWLPLRERLILTEAEPELIPELRSVAQATWKGAPSVTVHQVDLSTDWKKPLLSEGLDTVVSFNVLEHVLDDEKALLDLVSVLTHSGRRRLVTFVPAHNWAMGSVDLAYGHHRRYEAQFFKTFQQKHLPNSRLTYRYFNLVGLPGWFTMGRILKKKELGLGSVRAFEKVIPWIQSTDDWIHEKLRIPFGQSLLAVLEWDA